PAASTCSMAARPIWCDWVASRYSAPQSFKPTISSVSARRRCGSFPCVDPSLPGATSWGTPELPSPPPAPALATCIGHLHRQGGSVHGCYDDDLPPPGWLWRGFISLAHRQLSSRGRLGRSDLGLAHPYRQRQADGSRTVLTRDLHCPRIEASLSK